MQAVAAYRPQRNGKRRGCGSRDKGITFAEFAPLRGAAATTAASHREGTLAATTLKALERGAAGADPRPLGQPARRLATAGVLATAGLTALAAAPRRCSRRGTPCCCR